MALSEGESKTASVSAAAIGYVVGCCKVYSHLLKHGDRSIDPSDVDEVMKSALDDSNRINDESCSRGMEKFRKMKSNGIAKLMMRETLLELNKYIEKTLAEGVN